MAESAGRRTISGRLRFDTPLRRTLHIAVAAALAIAGLTAAIVASSAPSTRVSALATSGSFYALAESGDTLYAASDNGGSILLERSVDQGVDWTASPVPYSAVAGGQPWTHAAVAVDGANLILVASSGSPDLTVYPPGPVYATIGSGCSPNSTLLVASSPDDGRSWSTVNPLPASLLITSLQVSIDGSAAAVAWLGVSTSCTGPTAHVESITSVDAGQSWSSVQPLSVGGAVVPLGEQIEIAPASQGIALAFGVSASNGTTSQLGLYRMAPGSGAGFVPIGVLPAPTSWTLQGSPDTPAYLLTPTYLIPLTNPPYTALPFDQLQADAPRIGVLPTVVSLVPSGSGRVEVASTTSDNLGVDCWQVDTIAMTVERSCHVALGSALLPSNLLLPIVALLDGGGWWVAIGASGSYLPYSGGGNGGGGASTPPPIAGPAAVGTSVCLTGCSSAQGLVAYSYTSGAGAVRGLVVSAAGAVVLGGLAWLLVAAIARRTSIEALRDGTPGAGASPPDGEHRMTGRSARALYRAGLIAWTLVWVPLGVAVFAFSPSDMGPVLPPLVIVAGIVGATVAIPLHGVARSRVLTAYGLGPADVLNGMVPRDLGSGTLRAYRAASLAYGSWAAGAAMLVLAVIGLSTGFGASPPSGSASAGDSIGGVLVALVVLVFGALRSLYHYHIATAAAEAAGTARADGNRWPSERWAIWRTRLGAALLSWNPFLGLVLGWALQPSVPGAAYGLALAFLPVTYLGIALLGGTFGPSTWSSVADATVDSPRTAWPSSRLGSIDVPPTGTPGPSESFAAPPI